LWQNINTKERFGDKRTMISINSLYLYTGLELSLGTSEKSEGIETEWNTSADDVNLLGKNVNTIKNYYTYRHERRRVAQREIDIVCIQMVSALRFK
jgi:hypothetical protein